MHGICCCCFAPLLCLPFPSVWEEKRRSGHQCKDVAPLCKEGVLKEDTDELGVDTVLVLIGSVSYLLLFKPAKGVEKSFCTLSLLEKVLPVYKEVVVELKAAGASWIQFDEPALVLDLEHAKLQAFTKAYAELESTLSGSDALVVSYFADVPAEAYKTLTGLKGISGYGFDLVCGTKTLDLIKNNSFPSRNYLFAGVVDGRNILGNDLAASLTTLSDLESVVGKDKLVVSTSCSLMHIAVDLINETKLDDEIKFWLALLPKRWSKSMLLQGFSW